MVESEIPLEEKHGKKSSHTRVFVVNPWFLFGLFALAYIAFDFFSKASEDLLLRRLGQKSFTWKGYLTISIFLLVVLYLVTHWTRVPLIDFEQI